MIGHYCVGPPQVARSHLQSPGAKAAAQPPYGETPTASSPSLPPKSCFIILLLTLPPMLSALNQSHALPMELQDCHHFSRLLRRWGDKTVKNMTKCAFLLLPLKREGCAWWSTQLVWKPPGRVLWCQGRCSSGEPWSLPGDTAIGPSTWSCYVSRTESTIQTLGRYRWALLTHN